MESYMLFGLVLTQFKASMFRQKPVEAEGKLAFYQT